METNKCTFTENKIQFTLVLNDNVLFIEAIYPVNYAVWVTTIEEREKEVSHAEGPVRFITNYSPINIFNIIRDHVNGSLESKDINVVFAKMKNIETDISIEIITNAPFDNKIKDTTFILIHPQLIDFNEKVTKNMENQKNFFDGRIDELFAKHETVSQNISEVNVKIDNLDKRLTQFMEEISAKLNDFVPRTKIFEVNLKINDNEKRMDRVRTSAQASITNVNKRVDENHAALCAAIVNVNKRVDENHANLCTAIVNLDKKIEKVGIDEIITLGTEVSNFKAEITKLKNERGSYYPGKYSHTPTIEPAKKS